MNKKYYQISEFASIVASTPKALRLYESLGLLRSDRKPLSNYRYYSKNQMDSVYRIKRMQALGFSLKNIQKIFKTSNSFNLEDFKKILRDQYLKAETSIKEMEQRKDAISNIIRRIESKADTETLSKYEKDVFMGISTGFSKIDYLLNDCTGDQLIVVAGRPGMGKTALTLQMAYNFAEITDKKIVILSKKMSKDECLNRITTTMAEVRSSDSTYRKSPITAEEQNMLDTAANRLQKIPLYYEQIADLSISKIAETVNKQREELGLVIIDYFQDIKDVSNSNINMFKELIRKNSCSILLISTINEDVDNRADKKPHLQDISNYDLLSKVSDTFMVAYRGSYWDKNSKNPNAAEIDIYKHGETKNSQVRLVWNGQYCGYKE